MYVMWENEIAIFCTSWHSNNHNMEVVKEYASNELLLASDILWLISTE